jgi:hypothetical protein
MGVAEALQARGDDADGLHGRLEFSMAVMLAVHESR